MGTAKKSPTAASTGRPYAGWALACAVAGTAVLACVPVWDGWDTYAVRFAGMLLAAVLWVLAGVFGALRWPEKRDTLWLGSLSALALAVVASTSLGYAPLEMLTFGNGYYAGGVTWLVWIGVAGLASLVRPSRWLRTGLLVAQVPLVGVSLVAAIQALQGSKALGGFENSNHLVPGLLLAAPVSLALAATEQVKWRRVACVVSASAMAAAVLFAGSAAGILGLGVAAALAAALAPGLLGAQSAGARLWARRAAIGGAVVLCLLLVVVLAAPSALAGVGDTLHNDLFGGSLSTRAFFWGAAIRATVAHPILGVGADGFEVAAQRLMDASPGSVAALGLAYEWAPVVQDPHNLPLALLVSFGLVGAAAALCLAVAWVVAMRRFTRDEPGSVLRASFWIAAVAWGSAMLFLPASSQWGAYPAMMLGLALATRPAEEREPSPALHWGALAGGAVVSVLALALAGSVLVGNYWFAESESLEQDAYLAAMAKAEAAQPTMAYYRFVELDSRGQALSDSADELAAYQKAVDESGPAVRQDARYLVMLVRNSLDQAHATGRTDLVWEDERLGELTSVAPQLPEVKIENAHLAILKGDRDRARDTLLEVERYQQLRRAVLYRYYYAVLVDNVEMAQKFRALAVQQGIPERLLGQ